MEPMFFELPKGDGVHAQAIKIFRYYDDIRQDVYQYLTDTNTVIQGQPTMDQIQPIVAYINHKYPLFNALWLNYAIAIMLYLRDQKPDEKESGDVITDVMDTVVLSNHSRIKDKKYIHIDSLVTWVVPLYAEGYSMLLPSVDYQVRLHRKNNTKDVFYLGISNMPGRDLLPEFDPIFV